MSFYWFAWSRKFIFLTSSFEYFLITFATFFTNVPCLCWIGNCIKTWLKQVNLHWQARLTRPGQRAPFCAILVWRRISCAISRHPLSQIRILILLLGNKRLVNLVPVNNVECISVGIIGFVRVFANDYSIFSVVFQQCLRYLKINWRYLKIKKK